jgi:hypothetical protein
MDAMAVVAGNDALWSLAVIAVVVGPPALVVTTTVWVVRRLTGRRPARGAVALAPGAAAPRG